MHLKNNGKWPETQQKRSSRTVIAAELQLGGLQAITGACFGRWGLHVETVSSKAGLKPIRSLAPGRSLKRDSVEFLTEDPNLSKAEAAHKAADWRDRLGIFLSVLCLIHCLMTPIVLGLIPVGVALGFWEHGFHQVFLILVPLVAFVAFIPGWRQHGDSRIWYWGSVGIALLAAGVAFAEVFGHGEPGNYWPLAGELILTIGGGSCLIRAHMLNRKLCACCDHGHVPEH
ncbi:hypothetical protein BH10BDE1_BH10BDE1_02380 [soil metagenome]